MAITTVYNGIEYRSRLEARWAAFMANIGWETTYEPFDGDGYIPDFLVQGPRPMLVEVKPAVTLNEYKAAVPKAEAGLAGHWQHDIIIVGASPTPAGVLASTTLRDLEVPLAAWHGVPWPYKGSGEWEWGAARWAVCKDSGTFQVISPGFSLPSACTAQTCGAALSPSSGRALQAAWADACNDVKWRGRPA